MSRIRWGNLITVAGFVCVVFVSLGFVTSWTTVRAPPTTPSGATPVIINMNHQQQHKAQSPPPPPWKAATSPLVFDTLAPAPVDTLPPLSLSNATLGGWIQATYKKMVNEIQSDLSKKRRDHFNSLPLNTDNLIRKVQVWKNAPLSKPKITCLTHTYSPKHRNAHDMWTNWGKDCTKHFVYTNQTTPIIDGPTVVDMNPLPGGFGYHNIWNKVRHIFIDLHKKGELNEGAADWFFIAGDDVLLIVENLKKFLLSPEVMEPHAQRMPLLMGHRMAPAPNGGHFLSGAGYLLNDVAARLFMANIDNPVCSPTTVSFAEDVYMSQCLAALGCPPRDTMDPYGEDRIAIVSPYHLVEQTKNQAYMWWYAPWHRYRGRPMPTNNDAISVDAFLFHYMSDNDLRQTRATIYRKEENNFYG